jgi:hypothetical protein
MFLKPSIISVRQDLNNGERLVSVEAFSQTTTQVEDALDEVTEDHKLISKSESDYGGIKTSTYVYQINSSHKEDYEQKVILKTVPNGNAGVLVHSTQKFFTVTEPGVMGCDGAYSQSAESGAAARYPVATKAPRTYRKKATVNVYLTVSGDISEAEVAFSEEGVDWCSVAFDSFYTSEEGQAASATGSWRSFPNYLKGSTNGQAEATLLGKYAAFANSYGFGSTTYVQAGIYRVEVDKYTRSADGTQLYLKTIVTF